MSRQRGLAVLVKKNVSIGKIVKLKWVNWRVGLVIVVIALSAMMFIPGTGVREIHNAEQISNFALVDPRPGPNDWPWWRGTDGRNVAASDRVPLQWPVSDSEGWRITLTGQGHSTPSLWGDQLFLLTSDAATRRISLQSCNRASGRANWRTDLHQGCFQTVNKEIPLSSATPACDGQHVFAVAPVQNALSVTCVDFNGRIVWQRDAGPFGSRREYRSSPALFKSLVIVIADQERDSYITALHRQTGEIIWRVRRPSGDSSGTPVVATIGARSQLIVGGKERISSYDPATGDKIWTFRWSAERVLNSVAFDGEYVFAAGMHPDDGVVCIKADGSGDVTKSKLVWRQTRIAGENPSPVVHAGLLYILADDGRLTCLEAASGKIEWRTRLEGKFSASLVIAGAYLICSNEAGVSYIVQTGTTGGVIAENALSGGIIASPIVAGGSIFVRTPGSLHCIVAPASETVVQKPEPLKRRL